MTEVSEKPSFEDGQGREVQATSIGESSGGSSPLASPMTQTPTSADTAQASTPREDNRPPPTSIASSVTTQHSQGHSNSFATLEPYENFQRVNRQRRRNERRINQLISSYQPHREDTFPQFYKVNFPRLDISTKLNVIATDLDLKRQIGNPAKIKKISRDTLQIQVSSRNQGNKLAAVTKIANNDVVVQLDSAMNETKGTLYSETLSNSSIEELMEAFASQGVTKIERMKRMIDGRLTETHRYIITFNRSTLPPLLKVTDWHHELIELYIPLPMRCMKCFKTNHTKKYCNQENELCSQCSRPGHRSNECWYEPLCANCRGCHNALYRKCPYYEFRKEILATETRQKVTRSEAEDIVRERFREEGKTYSFALRRNIRTDQSSQESSSNPQQRSQPTQRLSQSSQQPSQTSQEELRLSQGPTPSPQEHSSTPDEINTEENFQNPPPKAKETKSFPSGARSRSPSENLESDNEPTGSSASDSPKRKSREKPIPKQPDVQFEEMMLKTSKEVEKRSTSTAEEETPAKDPLPKKPQPENNSNKASIPKNPQSGVKPKSSRQTPGPQENKIKQTKPTQTSQKSFQPEKRPKLENPKPDKPKPIQPTARIPVIGSNRPNNGWPPIRDKK